MIHTVILLKYITAVLIYVLYSVPMSDNLTNLTSCTVNGPPWHMFPQFIDNLLRPLKKHY